VRLSIPRFCAEPDYRLSGLAMPIACGILQGRQIREVVVLVAVLAKVRVGAVST